MDAVQAFKTAILPDEISDSKSKFLLQTAEDMILDEIGRDRLPNRLISAKVQLAVVIYNREGAEGESSRSSGSVSRVFIDGIPNEIRSRLKNYPRKAGAIYASDE